MLSVAKSWLGGSDTEQDKPVDGENTSEKEDEIKVENNESSNSENQSVDEELKKVYSAAKDWSNYLYSWGKSTTEIAAKTVTTTYKQLAEQVADKDQLMEKTPVLGDFHREQTKFIAEQRATNADSQALANMTAGQLPWEDCDNKEEEDNLRQQILDLSSDERHFTRNLPPGSNFDFQMSLYQASAMALLKEDSKLKEMRFKLVPRKVKEDAFWRNYFYRISLIKQSARLQSITKRSGSASPSLPGKIESLNEEARYPSEDRASNKSAEEKSNRGDSDGGNKTTVTPILNKSTEEFDEELEKELQEFELTDDGNKVSDENDQELLDQLDLEVLNE